MSYIDEARSKAEDTFDHFFDELLAEFLRQGSLDDKLDPEYHQEYNGRYFSAQNAIALLDELSEYEEKDSGLWQGMEPREAICVQASCTFLNAVRRCYSNLIGKINEDFDLADLHYEYTVAKSKQKSEKEQAVKARLEALVEEFN